jgi:hypothetical protein
MAMKNSNDTIWNRNSDLPSNHRSSRVKSPNMTIAPNMGYHVMLLPFNDVYLTLYMIGLQAYTVMCKKD